LSSSFSSRPTWTPTAPNSSFPPTPPTFSPKEHLTTQHSHHNGTLLRDRRCLWHPKQAALLFVMATLVVLSKSHLLNNGNLTLIFMTPTR
jgi:hypothetical protein